MLNTITKLRYPDGREVAFVDWTDQPLFSTCDLLTGFTRQEINLFQYTVGDSVPAAFPGATATQRTATEGDTNLSTPGSMASTEEFLVYAIKPEVFQQQIDAPAPNPDFTTAVPVSGTEQPTVEATRLAWLQLRLLLTLEISQKEYAHAGFGYFNTGFGVSTLSIVSSPATNGSPSQEAVRSFVIPQHMGGQEKFRVVLSNPGGLPVNFGNANSLDQGDNADLTLRVRVLLDGLHKRPVS